MWGAERLFDFSSITDPRVSPDGAWCAYVLSQPRLEEDRYEQWVVVRGLKDGSERFLANASTPRFSPDSKRLCYAVTAEQAGRWDIHVMDLATGSSRKILEAESLVDVAWSPRGDRLCFVTSRRRGDPHLVFDDDMPIWFNTKGYLDSETVRFTVVDASSGAPLQHFEEELLLLPNTKVALWHGDFIVYNSPRRDNPFTRFDIYAWDGSTTRTLFKDVSFSAVDSDGSNLLLYGKPKKNHHAEHNYAYLWDGSNIKPVTERFGWDNSWCQPRLGGRGEVYYVSAEEGRLALNVVDAGGTHRRIVWGECWVTVFDVGRAGVVVYVKESPTQPAELYLWSGGEERRLTDYNVRLAETLGFKPLRKLRYKSVGGLEIDGWYLRPDVPEGSRAPLVVFIHGGPKGMYGYRFDFLGQLLAHKGYYVLYTNPRGSDGYDERFATCILGRYGEDDFKDILNGVEELRRLGEPVDPDSMGVTGISGGGYLTNWAITHTSIFRAAISENGIANWFTMYTYSDIGYWFCRDLIAKNPLVDEEYRRLSPIYLADRVTTPVLFIHSVEDYRCPLEQSVSFHQLLRSMGKESYIAVFRRGDHTHSLSGTPKHRLKRLRLIEQFFDAKLVRHEEGFKPDLAATEK